MGVDFGSKLKNIKTVNPWGLLSFLLFIVLVCMGGYYGYMTLQAKRLNNTLLDKQTLVQQEQLKLNTLKKNVSYVRFL